MSPNEHVFVCFYHQTYCFGNFWTLPRALSRYARVTTLTAPWRWTWTRGRTATPRTLATSSPRCTAACTSGRTRTTSGVVSTIIYRSRYYHPDLHYSGLSPDQMQYLKSFMEKRGRRRSSFRGWSGLKDPYDPRWVLLRLLRLATSVATSVVKEF